MKTLATFNSIQTANNFVYFIRRKFECDLVVTQTDSRTFTVSVKDKQYDGTVPHALRVMSSLVRSYEDALNEVAVAIEEDRLDDYLSSIIAGNENMSLHELQERRIENILGKDLLKVSDKSLDVYLNYLKKHLVKPCLLTGIEDFRWEEYYVIGPGDEKEYEELKKTRPSYTDTFEFLEFDDDYCSVEEGLFIWAKRVSDRKKFPFPLEELKAVDDRSKNYILLHDYSCWFVNY